MTTPPMRVIRIVNLSWYRNLARIMSLFDLGLGIKLIIDSEYLIFLII
jgi:hypothetical protein